jgi:hypothetical protein
MITTLALVLVLVQDPRPTAKTVEDRLRELDEKIAALEKKHRALSDENAAMEKRIADAKAGREKYARDKAAAWKRTYAALLELTPEKSAEIEELQYGWHKEEIEKPGANASKWPAREEALKALLTPKQASLLGRKIREERETQARGTVNMLLRSAKLPAEKSGPAETLIMGKIKLDEDILLPEAHPQKMVESWTRTFAALESSVSELSLTEEEAAGLRKFLDQWKPRQR